MDGNKILQYIGLITTSVETLIVTIIGLIFIGLSISVFFKHNGNNPTDREKRKWAIITIFGALFFIGIMVFILNRVRSSSRTAKWFGLGEVLRLIDYLFRK